MIDIVKEMAQVIAMLPHIAVWILTGLLIYKVCVIGSIYGVVRLGITKLFDAYTRRLESKEKPQIVDYNIGGLFIRTDGTLKRFIDVVKQAKRESQGPSGLNYLHDKDVAWIEDAVKMKIEGAVK